MAHYLVTGGAGFIGSHLVRALLDRGDRVCVIDDFSTGRLENIEEVLNKIELIQASICDRDALRDAFQDVDYCLHHAAFVSVPGSVERPLDCSQANVEGSLNVFMAARDAGVKRVVYASSSAVYGDVETCPIQESSPLSPVSPYGVGKVAGEMYARVMSDLHGVDLVGLRYFNVFGPRQDPASPYSAAIPVFVKAMLEGKPPPVNGDGLQSRDFTYVDNVVDANLLACQVPEMLGGVYNVSCGQGTSLLELVNMLNQVLGTTLNPRLRDALPGDIRHSWSDINLARETFGYSPDVLVREGLTRMVRHQQEQAYS